MKIVYVSPHGHNGAHSGMRVRTTNICGQFSEMPDIDVLCMSPWTPPEKISHEYFNLDVNWPRRLLRLASLNIRLLRLRPDAVISETPLAPISFGTFKSIHVIHDAKFVTEMGRKGGTLVRWMHWLSARIAAKVLTVSNSERSRIASALKISEKNILVSYNGVSDIWLTPPPGQTNIEFDLIYVSNFARHKGHKRLLAALRGTSQRVLFIGADFGERDMLAEYARECSISLTIREGLSDKELIQAYDTSGVFVFPSTIEGFGIPYLEARVRGLPVIAQDLPIFHELQSALGGEIIDFDDAAQFHAALAKVRNSARERPDITSFTWPTIASKLLHDIAR